MGRGKKRGSSTRARSRTRRKGAVGKKDNGEPTPSSPTTTTPRRGTDAGRAGESDDDGTSFPSTQKIQYSSQQDYDAFVRSFGSFERRGILLFVIHAVVGGALALQALSSASPSPLVSSLLSVVKFVPSSFLLLDDVQCLWIIRMIYSIIAGLFTGILLLLLTSYDLALSPLGNFLELLQGPLRSEPHVFEIDAQNLKPSVFLSRIEPHRQSRKLLGVNMYEKSLKDGDIETREIRIPRCRHEGDDSLSCERPDGPIHVTLLRRRPSLDHNKRRARQSKAKGVLCWIHGGGMAIGTAKDSFCGVLAALNSEVLVASVDYALSPEWPFPAPVLDCYDVLRHLADPANASSLNVVSSPSSLALGVGGVSAGGGLAAAVALMARDSGIPLHLQLLLIPMLAPPSLFPSHITEARRTGLPAETMMWFWRNYTPQGPHDWIHPLCVPFNDPEEGRGLPLTFVWTGKDDMLRDEGEAYATRLEEAGVDVKRIRMPGTHAGTIITNQGRVKEFSAEALSLMLHRGRM